MYIISYQGVEEKPLSKL